MTTAHFRLSLVCKFSSTLLIGAFLVGITFHSLEVHAQACPSTEITNGVTVTNTCTLTSGIFTVDVGGAILTGGGGSSSVLVDPGLFVEPIRNSGAITSSTGAGIFNNGGTITTLTNTNTGTITGSGGDGIYNLGTITPLTNTGTITGSGYGISNSGTITTLTNTGTITGYNRDIYNTGTISVFNNLQGASSSAVTFTVGNLPAQYNIIIRNASNYGQLSAAGSSGSMAFNIYGNAGTTLVSGVNASVISANRYLNILQGFSSLSGVTGTTGTYSGYSYSLVADATLADSWDLLTYLPGPSTAGTQASLANTAQVLQGVYTLQNAVLANSFTYDCSLFDVNNICISAGGRNTAVSAANGLNNTSALLIAAYRVMPTVRIGAYADQNLSVNNAGSTVNLGNNTPLIGLFGAWNERLDGTGTEVKVSAAYGQKNTTVTRSVVGTSEPGSGSSQLNSQGAQVTVKYGFGLAENVVVSPYVGVRYSQNNMGGYTEGASSTVTAPLTYSALNTNATTALAGVGASYRLIPKATVFASAGVETDTNTANGTYIASGVAGLTPINFNANPVKTRPTATLGAYYDIVKNQRLGITGIYRQEAYQAVSTTTVMATYTVGL